MRSEKRLTARLVMLVALLAAASPFLGFGCGRLGDQAGIEFHIENQGKDPMHFIQGSSNTRIAIGERKKVAEVKVDVLQGRPADGRVTLTMKRMDIDLGTLRIVVRGDALEYGVWTKIFIRMSEPEYFEFEFTCDNPLVGLDYQRPVRP